MSPIVVAGTAITQASPVSSSPAVGEGDTARAPGDPADGRTRVDGRAQRPRQGLGEALVAARDARRGLVTDVGDAGQAGCRHEVGRARRGDLEPGDQHLARAVVDLQTLEERAAPAADRGRGRRPARRPPSGRPRPARPAPAPVRRAARGGRTASPCPTARGRSRSASSRISVLPGSRNSAPISTTAPLASSRDHTRPPTRSRASSTTHLVARAAQLVGRAEAREAGADDDHPHVQSTSRRATAQRLSSWRFES